MRSILLHKACLVLVLLLGDRLLIQFGLLLLLGHETGLVHLLGLAETLDETSLSHLHQGLLGLGLGLGLGLHIDELLLGLSLGLLRGLLQLRDIVDWARLLSLH